MRLGPLDYGCGCDNRKYIMFQAGKAGIVEGAILTVAVLSILVAWKVKPNAKVG